MSWLKKYFYFFPVLFFLPAIGNFFSADDWFHLRISQIDSLGQFLNFFSFTQTPQSASFYRPISTQVFFSIFQSLFGLSAWPYYLFGILLFTYSIYLVYKFSDNRLAAIIYVFSVSNFTRVYFLSAYQELFLVVFSLLTLLNFKSKPKLSLLFFVLALLSKETAIVLPALIFLLNSKDKKSLASTIYHLRSTILISVVFLYFRLFHFGLAVGDSYLWDFSPGKAANTLMWYTLWSFGAPELLVDYVGSGLRLVPKFFVDYPLWWKIIIPLLFGTVSTAILLFIKKIRHCEDESPWQSRFDVIKYILFFLVSLLPVLFLPSHKFALELGLPLVGFALAVAWLIPKKLNILSFCFFAFFVSLNLFMNYLTYTRHYSVSRGHIAQKVFQYINTNYSTPPKDHYFQFINDARDNGQIWGQSRQISQALSGSDFFKVLYRNPDYKVYYQDNPTLPPTSLTSIQLSTKQFLTNEK